MPIACAEARTLLPCGLARSFVPLSGVVLLGLLWFAAATLLARRLAGAFDVPLSATMLLAVDAISATIAAAVRLSGPVFKTSSRTKDFRQWWKNIPLSLPTVALVVLGIALSLPDTSLVGLFALWTFLLVEELWAWLSMTGSVHRFSTHLFRRLLATPSRSTSPLAVSRTPLAAAREPISSRFPQASSTIDSSITQHIVRTFVDADHELIRGQVRISFIPGQRTAATHLAFCPPFDQTPPVEFRQSSGPGARIKLAQVYPYGARFELKLAAVATESTSVVLDFSITGKGVTIT